jgi:hydroxymethylbilane synthase
VRRLILATRGSRLALAQSNMVADMLRAAHPDLEVELRVIQTKGDLVLDRALSKIGDKGLFVKEIEGALIEREADLAVHSCKDLESTTPDGLVLAAFPRRADPRDVLISRHGFKLDQLPAGSTVGTSSLRRGCQIRSLRLDLRVIDLRGNVDTRLRKAQSDEYDAIVLAAAGLERLEVAAPITEFFDPQTFVPMVAQGALAIECRADDHDLRDLLQPLNDPATAIAVQAERAFLRRLQGGCQVPIAAYATVENREQRTENREQENKRTREQESNSQFSILNSQFPAPSTQYPASNTIHLRGLIGLPDGSRVVRGELSGSDAEAVGVGLAERLLAEGGAEMLDRLSRVVPAIEAPEAV